METIAQNKQFWKARCTGNFLFKQSEQQNISLEKTNWFELVENHLLTFPQKVGLSNLNLVEEFGHVRVIVYILLMSKFQLPQLESCLGFFYWASLVNFANCSSFNPSLFLVVGFFFSRPHGLCIHVLVFYLNPLWGEPATIILAGLQMMSLDHHIFKGVCFIARE